MNLGLVLKENREKQKISQRKLADMAGVTQHAIYFWENGKRDMTISSADKVFKALGVTVKIGAEREGEDEADY